MLASGSCPWARSAEDLHIESKKLHQPQFRLTGLVTQERVNIVDVMESPCDHGHRDNRRARTALDDGFCRTRLDALFKQIHSYMILAKCAPESYHSQDRHHSLQ